MGTPLCGKNDYLTRFEYSDGENCSGSEDFSPGCIKNTKDCAKVTQDSETSLCMFIAAKILVFFASFRRARN